MFSWRRRHRGNGRRLNYSGSMRAPASVDRLRAFAGYGRRILNGSWLIGDKPICEPAAPSAGRLAAAGSWAGWLTGRTYCGTSCLLYSYWRAKEKCDRADARQELLEQTGTMVKLAYVI